MSRYPIGHPWNPEKRGAGRPSGTGRGLLDQLAIGRALHEALAENQRRKDEGLDHRTKGAIYKRLAFKHYSSTRNLHRYLNEWRRFLDDINSLPPDLQKVFASNNFLGDLTASVPPEYDTFDDETWAELDDPRLY